MWGVVLGCAEIFLANFIYFQIIYQNKRSIDINRLSIHGKLLIFLNLTKGYVHSYYIGFQSLFENFIKKCEKIFLLKAL